MKNNGKLMVAIFLSVAVLSFADGSGMDFARRLDVAGENVSVQAVTRYYSVYRHGPTQLFYHLRDQNAVVTLRLGNQSTDFYPEIAVHIFDPDLTDEGISEWINNQHSDGLYFGAPEPTEVYTLSEQSYAITSRSAGGHAAGTYGDEYDTYNLEISVDDVSVDGLFHLEGFVAEATVHVQTRDIDDL